MHRASAEFERGIADYHDRVARTGFSVVEVDTVLQTVAFQTGNVRAVVKILNGRRESGRSSPSGPCSDGSQRYSPTAMCRVEDLAGLTGFDHGFGVDV